jgi:hypothetical protein
MTLLIEKLVLPNFLRMDGIQLQILEYQIVGNLASLVEILICYRQNLKVYVENQDLLLMTEANV